MAIPRGVSVQMLLNKISQAKSIGISTSQKPIIVTAFNIQK
jgi:hypothetical protein